MTEAAAPSPTGAEATAPADNSTILTGVEVTQEGGNTEQQAPEGAQAEGVEAGKEADKPADKPANTTPEKYELQMPEGVELDTALIDQWTPALKEAGITNEQANKLAPLIAELRKSEAQAMQEAVTQQAEAWGKAVRDDKELGGANYNKTVEQAQRGFAAISDPEAQQLLNTSGLGNHPALVRMMVKVDAMLREDAGVTGATTGPSKSAGAVLFDHPTSNHTR